MASQSPRRGWATYRAVRGAAESTVIGDLRVLPEFEGPPGGRARDLLVHLPSDALDSGRRYPVLYMHDGQNLFDAATSFAGEWRVDETLAQLAVEGLELVVVGIPNGGDDRFAEYTPYRGLDGIRPAGGRGPTDRRWVVERVKPAVDAAFPTRPERAATGIMGSSLGGLISLWAALEHAETFARIAAMSPAIVPGQGPIHRRLRRLATLPERLYLDVGGREGSMAPTEADGRRWSAAFVRDAHRLRDELVGAGLRDGAELRYVEDRDAIHHESAWARRLPEALRFLFEIPAPGAAR
jgi:predicted alpha/beta superfamily hydrolase